jgi:hypothetical protein
VIAVLLIVLAARSRQPRSQLPPAQSVPPPGAGGPPPAWQPPTPRADPTRDPVRGTSGDQVT